MSSVVWAICCQLIVASCLVNYAYVVAVTTSASDSTASSQSTVDTTSSLPLRDNYTTWTLSRNDSIASGGIMITVSGQGIKETVVYTLSFGSQSKSGDKIPTKSCATMMNETSMLTCYTPAVDLSNDSCIRNTPQSFHVYVSIDDQEPVPIDKTILVYCDPTFQTLENASFTQDQGNTISIKSDKELKGFGLDDVHIQITVDAKTTLMCDDVTIDKMEITCKPPSIDPQTIQYKDASAYTLPIQIQIGLNMNKQLGNLVYSLPVTFSVIIIVMIVVLGLIVIVSLIIGMATVCGCECACCSGSSETDQQYLTPDDTDYETIDTSRRMEEPGYDKLHMRAKLSKTGRYKWSPEQSNVDMTAGRITKRGEDNYGFEGHGSRKTY
jgi:hypothetical protein